MALPFLPGRSRNTNLGKERFHKSQHFDYSGGLQMLVGADKPGIGGEPLTGQKVQPKHSVYPGEEGSGLPSWIAFDKQALCFDAYFQETVPQAQRETYRIRKCKIYFYLEDDTIQVVEPESKNSGIAQGTLIRRHRVPLPPPDDDQLYNVFHFNINQQMVLYSRTFTVTDCDSFTRSFLTRLGVIVNAPADVPDDPYSSFREQLEKSMNPLRPYERRDTLKQFLDHNGKVLRFFCLWDDSDSAFGDPRELVLHYFLADDTIEIVEVFAANCGRDALPKFLRRMKLPKGGAAQDDFYKDSDLSIGVELNVWGRKVLLTDCDPFTKEFYRSRYGIEDFTPVLYKAPPAPKPPRPVPPYNGFGSEEDSLSSCQGLLPKHPQKDFRKFLEKDKCGLDSKVLNFRAKMVTTNPVDQEKVFSISFYLCDDSISVFQQAQKNSGVFSGKFLQRGRVKKPGQELFKSETSEYFAAQDLYVGATVCLHGSNFHILEADEYTLSYMERHAEEFPKANVGNILSKLRSVPEEQQTEIRKFLALSDPGSTGFISYEALRGLLTGLDCGLSEHEVLVLSRSFSERPRPDVDVGLMLAAVQDVLRRKNFERFPHMARAFAHHDRHKTGRLSTKDMRTICKGFHLPLSENLLAGLLRKFADGDEIDYHAFLAGINWAEHPAPPVMPEDVLKFDVNQRFDVDGPAVKNVNYSALLQDVFSDRPAAAST